MTELPAPGPSGRRANGLVAHDWGALVDLDPRLSEGLLERLAGAGVAAYVEPATAVDTLRAVVMPARPLDRLWVDATRADAAREVVASEVADLTALLAEDEPGATPHDLVLPVPRTAARRVLPPPALPGPPRAAAPAEPAAERPGEPGPLDDDAVFAQIVAGFALDLPADGERRWPEAEDLPPLGRRRRGDPQTDPADPDPAGPADPEAGRGDGPDRPRPPHPSALPPPAGRRPLPSGPRDWEEPVGADEGHYVPPPPPPVPRVRLRTIGALACVLLGLLVLFAPNLLGLSTADLAVGVLGLVLLAGGAGALVWWVRDSSSGSGPDDGAVV